MEQKTASDVFDSEAAKKFLSILFGSEGIFHHTGLRIFVRGCLAISRFFIIFVVVDKRKHFLSHSTSRENPYDTISIEHKRLRWIKIQN